MEDGNSAGPASFGWDVVQQLGMKSYGTGDCLGEDQERRAKGRRRVLGRLGGGVEKLP